MVQLIVEIEWLGMLFLTSGASLELLQRLVPVQRSASLNT
ncbi:MAG: hypothetical protein RL308_2068 [Bacteroidota bacterium]|jgi:hypothetical protein